MDMPHDEAHVRGTGSGSSYMYMCMCMHMCDVTCVYYTWFKIRI